MIVYNNNLYVVGQFDSAGGLPANNIAMWDGSNWHNLGSGIQFIYQSESYNPSVYGICVYKGRLYVSGYFNIAGGVNCNNIAAWDGNSWSAISNSIYYQYGVGVGKLVTDGTHIFTNCGPSIWQYDGKDWYGFMAYSYIEQFGCFQNFSRCYDLYINNNTLVVGGAFLSDTVIYNSITANLTPKHDIAYYNIGSGVWTSPTDNLGYNGVYALLNFNNTLYAASGSLVTWSAYGNSLVATPGGVTYATIQCLASYHGYLFAGGAFTNITDIHSTIPANNIVKWNGYNMQIGTLGSGLSWSKNVNDMPLVNAMVVYNGSLYVAGQFDSADGQSANNIAIWTDDSAMPPQDTNLQATMDTTDPAPAITTTLYPNPNRGLFYFGNGSWPTGTSAEIYSMNGDMLTSVLLNNSKTEVNMQGATKGIYIYRIKSQAGIMMATGKFIVE
jgi:hypothetical protein